MRLPFRSAAFAAALFLLASTLAARQRTASAAPPESPEADEVVIALFDPSGRPLRDADVRLAFEDERAGLVNDPSAAGGTRQALRLDAPPLASSVDALLRERPIVHPDSNGRLHAAWPRGRGLLISARRDDQWGFRWFDRDWRETVGRRKASAQPLQLELVLAPDWDLCVRVVDELGLPLTGIPIRIRCGSFGRGMQSDREELRFEHVGYELRDAASPLIVGAASLLAEPVEEQLDPRRPPAAPVVLRLPATGSVEVAVLDADGELFSSPAFLALRFASVDPPASRRRFDAIPLEVSGGARGGVARFDGVALERELEVSWRGSEPASHRRFQGPVLARETVRVALSAPEPAPPAAPEAGSPSSQHESAAVGSLRGAVLLDPGFPMDQIAIELRGTGSVRWTSSACVDREGKFELAGAPVGPARLEIRPVAAQVLRPDQRPVVFSAEIAIAAGENADARLASIDLRGELFRHEIDIASAGVDGRIRARAFFHAARDDDAPCCYALVGQTPIVLVSPWETIDVELFAPGYRSTWVRELGARAAIELEPGIPVRLRLQSDGVLPEPPRYLKAVLVPVDAPRRVLDWEGPAFDASREIATNAWRPGRARVQWVVIEQGEGGGYSGRELAVSPPQFVDVLDASSEQTFAVAISAEELARGIELLSSR